jgi:hypothetical protein
MTIARMPAAQIRVDWAMFSKVPGKVMDYEILSASLPNAEVDNLVKLSLTGHPEGPAMGRPEELPWLWMGGGSPQQPYCALGQVAWSDKTDGTKQIIAPTRLIAAPWQHAAESCLTYGGMYQLFRSLQWERVDAGPVMATGGSPLICEPPEYSAQFVADRIEGPDGSGYGFDWIAAIAASLLDGQNLAFTGSGGYPPLMQRLAILDCVCALLPYAYRAQVTAATWATHRLKHHARISFTDRARSDQTEVRLDKRGVPSPQGNAARAYLAELRRIRSEVKSTQEIVEHLAGRRDPLSCQTAEDAHSLLLGLDRPRQFYQDILAGKGSAIQIQWWLNKAGWNSVPSGPIRESYVNFLTDTAFSKHAEHPEAESVLRRFWTTDITNRVAALVHQHLKDNKKAEVQSWFTLANQAEVPGAAQSLMVALTLAAAQDSMRGMAVRYADLLFAPPEGIAPMDGAVHQILLSHPRAAGTLITELAESEKLPRLMTVWRQCLPLTPHWARPFVAVVEGRPELLDAGQIDALWRHWPEGADPLLALAINRGTMRATFMGMWTNFAWLVARACGNRDEKAIHRMRMLVDRTRDACIGQSQLLSPAGLARLDVLLIALGRPAVGAYSYIDVPEERYMTEFLTCWGGQDLAAARMSMETWLVTSLTQGGLSGASTKRLIAMVDLVAAHKRPEAANVVGRFLASNPEQYHQLGLPEGWGRLIGGWVELVHKLAEKSRTHAHARDIVSACSGALKERADMQSVAEALRPWVADHPERVVDLLFRLRGTQNQLCYDFSNYLVQAVCGHMFGDTDQRLQAYLASRTPFMQNLQKEMQTRTRKAQNQMLSIAAEPSKGKGILRSTVDFFLGSEGDYR